ncbi:uncharacterized protein [Amphiura filiformis]|uniref:uncharacterized protein n=1 Tax=Amphiura filiformis TaxID=82378 RepID=UPI003B20E8B6
MTSKIPRVNRTQKTDEVSLKLNSTSKSRTTTSMTSNKSASSSFNRSKKQAVSTVLNGTQKTMSYNQLKQEVGILQEENCDLRNKYSKHQNALHSSQKTTKHLQKENQELKEQMEKSEKEYTESMETKTQEWTSKNSHLEGRLVQCEVKLEELGVDPVNLDRLDGSSDAQETQQRTQAVENANILKQKLEDNIVRSQQMLKQVKDVSSQCQLALAELDD